MKRIFAVLLALSLLLLAACSKGVSPTEPSPDRACHAGPPTNGDRRSDGALPDGARHGAVAAHGGGGPFTVTYAHAQADTHGSGEVWVQLLAEVTNTGSEPLTLGAADWTVCTPDGTELAKSARASPAYPQTIEPGEKGLVL